MKKSVLRDIIKEELINILHESQSIGFDELDFDTHAIDKFGSKEMNVIKDSVASALRLFNKGSMSVLDPKDIQDITELVLKIMKSKIRSKYGIQGLET